jgi:hypothetical protein
MRTKVEVRGQRSEVRDGLWHPQKSLISGVRPLTCSFEEKL